MRLGGDRFAGAPILPGAFVFLRVLVPLAVLWALVLPPSGTPSTSGLVAAYSFDEGSGGTVVDASGNGNDGSIANATRTASGKHGSALSFNGSSSLVTIPDAAFLHLTSAMTLEAWVDPAATSSSWQDVIYKGNDNYYLEASSTSGGQPAGGGSWGKAYGSVLASNTWTHLAVTYDGATLRLYVNGTLASSVAVATSIPTSSNPLEIGGDAVWGQYFAGLIDDVRVYNIALTQAQIQNDMTTPVEPHDPATPGLLAGGARLNAGDSLRSPNGSYHLNMQNDGNLVAYDAANTPIWASATSGTASYAVMQADGNLVVYSAAGQPLWASNTDGNPGAYLTLANDGYLTVDSAAGTPLWGAPGLLAGGARLNAGDSLRSPNGSYHLNMQNDGNLVAYDAANTPIWASATSGTASYAVMQTDGNLVVYSAAGQPLWASNTDGHPGAYLTLADDGHLSVDSAAGTPLWGAVGLLAGGARLNAGDSLRSPNGSYHLNMQNDGNLVAYDAANTQIWASATSGTGSYAVMQTDGNLVVYSAAGQPLWASNTDGHPGAYLTLADDGQPTVRSSSGEAITVLTSQPSGPTYPLEVSANGRYLVDQHDQPFLLVGDSPQSLIGNLSALQAEAYFSDRQAHGFNAVWVNLLCDDYTYCNADGTTFDGIKPFTSGNSPSTYDLATPNPAYFQRVDDIINLAAKYGIAVFLDPIETGGWLTTLGNNGLTKAFDYGVYLGNRYKTFPNIVWLSGNDFQNYSISAYANLVLAVMQGIGSGDHNHLQTVELSYNNSSSLDSSIFAPSVALNAAYTYYPTYAEVLHAYNQSPTMPAFMIEANYEFENNTGMDPSTPEVLRNQEYWTMLSGATGQFYGNLYSVRFGSGWQNNLDTTGVTQLGYETGLLKSRAWYDLVPDQNHSVLTAGYGTFADTGPVHTNDYATAAHTPDGSLVIVYLPSSRTITIDMSKLTGNVTARWFDPTNEQLLAGRGLAVSEHGLEAIHPARKQRRGQRRLGFCARVGARELLTFS